MSRTYTLYYQGLTPADSPMRPVQVILKLHSTQVEMRMTYVRRDISPLNSCPEPGAIETIRTEDPFQYLPLGIHTPTFVLDILPGSPAHRASERKEAASTQAATIVHDQIDGSRIESGEKSGLRFGDILTRVRRFSCTFTDFHSDCLYLPLPKTFRGSGYIVLVNDQDVTNCGVQSTLNSLQSALETGISSEASRIRKLRLRFLRYGLPISQQSLPPPPPPRCQSDARAIAPGLNGVLSPSISLSPPSSEVNDLVSSTAFSVLQSNSQPAGPFEADLDSDASASPPIPTGVNESHVPTRRGSFFVVQADVEHTVGRLPVSKLHTIALLTDYLHLAPVGRWPEPLIHFACPSRHFRVAPAWLTIWTFVRQVILIL
ncbi:unnamed protein product [Protopolystoma xenopodis]|uniref:Uncharacterized protein n=1 Tax=Protopolystoma xenopodis TaxID=117903 RepID=A0A448WCG5_9PLAT|nr:unnamed protein product [Protopolystoma xenopodis]